ncbi:sensor histidine kinase [Streptosporangium sp. NBC_01756]|uniref:sensor histidine kinase n=1 Tax=Streptosporangium sp. NBC_01756 TaxID=2975950 RepID=UPI002DDACA53|nr:histidine kinase [Streptosporangium sp. NBC_01756]WSC89341.1 histidine kinase [Streptosporangium sp. NBC_01756]
MGDTHRVVYWIQRLSEFTLIGWLSLLLLIDLAVAPGGDWTMWLRALCGAAGVLAVLWRRTRRVSGFAVLLALSFTCTLIIEITGATGMPGLAETGSLLILTIGGLRWIEPIRRAALFSAASMIVLEAAAGRVTQTGHSLATGFLVLFGWSVAAAIGAYLRFQLERRKEAVSSVRRAERLELARELHDLVAHHITGIVVQAQAARVVAERQPEAVVPSLEAIAGAGADALTSMRRLVSVLRAEDEAARSPGTRLMDMRVMVERFSAGGPRVAFEIGQGVTDETLTPEVMTTLHRVLQESLTNVRRHAPGAGWVEADLRLVGDHDGWASNGDRDARGRPGPTRSAVRLRVRNHGSAADIRVSRLGGGFGLVGMAERVEALGGRLVAGPTPEGAWEVLAEFLV